MWRLPRTDHWHQTRGGCVGVRFSFLTIPVPSLASGADHPLEQMHPSGDAVLAYSASQKICVARLTPPFHLACHPLWIGRAEEAVGCHYTTRMGDEGHVGNQIGYAAPRGAAHCSGQGNPPWRATATNVTDSHSSCASTQRPSHRGHEAYSTLSTSRRWGKNYHRRVISHAVTSRFPGARAQSRQRPICAMHVLATARGFWP